MRFEGDDAAAIPDEPREEQRLPSDSGADGDDGVSRQRRVAVDEQVARIGRADIRRRGTLESYF